MTKTPPPYVMGWLVGAGILAILALWAIAITLLAALEADWSKATFYAFTGSVNLWLSDQALQRAGGRR